MQQVTNLKEVEEVINVNGDMVIGKNEMNDIIIMSFDEYKNNIFNKETEEKLLKSEEDIEKGKTRKGIEVVKEFRAKYGF